MPKLSSDFFAVIPGRVYPETLPAGTEVDGKLAEMARACGVLEGSAPAVVEAPAAPKARKDARKAPEKQAFTAAPENKS